VADLDDVALRRAFDDLLRQTLPNVRLEGVQTTLVRARRRRTRRIALIAVVAVLLISVPAGLYAISQRQDGRTLPIPPSIPTTSPATSTPPTDGPPTADPVTPTPVPSLQYTRATPGPLELSEATLTLDWSVAVTGVDYGCRSGAIRFSQGTYVQSATVRQDILAVGHTDVNQDGTTDVVALVKCWHGDLFGLPQLVALRKVSGSAYNLMGVVVRGGMSPVQVGEITAFETAKNGTVRVEVHDTVICCGQNPDGTATQWRTYSWAGFEFVQTDGPTTFRANPQVADVVIKPTPVNLSAKDTNGLRHGTIRITVVNNGPLAVEDVRILLPNNGMTADAGGDWSRCNQRVCKLGAFDVGRSVNLTFPFAIASELSAGQNTIGMIGLFAGGYSYGFYDVPLAT
jgi:hypothetical protein